MDGSDSEVVLFVKVGIREFFAKLLVVGFPDLQEFALNSYQFPHLVLEDVMYFSLILFGHL